MPSSSSNLLCLLEANKKHQHCRFKTTLVSFFLEVPIIVTAAAAIIILL